MYSMHGVADYDWAQFKDAGLTDAEKATIASIVDSFKSKADVQAWVNTSTAAAKGDSAKEQAFGRLVGPVLALSEQKKIIDLTAMFDVTPKKINNNNDDDSSTEETPWLMYAAGAALLYLILKK